MDTVRAYYMGESLFVEVDVVLDENMPLHETHDIGTLIGLCGIVCIEYVMCQGHLTVLLPLLLG